MKAIIFDFDGTILDTEFPWFQVMQSLYEQIGLTLHLADYIKCVGTDSSVYDPYTPLIEASSNKLSRDQWTQKAFAHHKELMQNLGPREGILDLIERAQKNKIRMGVASSSPRVWVTSNLQRLGLLHHFEFIHTADDVSQVKPDPELYLKSIDFLKIAPHECAAIEDSEHGLSAAHKAGLICYAYPNELTKDSNFEKAHKLISSPREILIPAVLR